MKKFLPVIIVSLFMLVACVKNADVEPESITLNYTDLELQVGSGKQLLASRYDATQITWTSSDTTVASIDSKGVIVALKEGQTTIDSEKQAIQYNCNMPCKSCAYGY